MRGEYNLNENSIAFVEYDYRMEYEIWFDHKKAADTYYVDFGCSANEILETLVGFKFSVSYSCIRSFSLKDDRFGGAMRLSSNSNMVTVFQFQHVLRLHIG